MDDKLSMLFCTTPDSIRTVEENTFVLCYQPMGNQITEYRTGALPSPDASRHLYTVQASSFVTAWAIHHAITCTKPNGQTFQPSFCLSFQLRYISPAGVKNLLAEHLQTRQKLPGCFTLEDLYMLLEPQLKVAARHAAAKLSDGKLLPYHCWWQDMNTGTTFRDALENELRPLLSRHGFRLEAGSLKFMGLASVPAD